MSEAAKSESQPGNTNKTEGRSSEPVVVLHRVCITCNNMFQVTLEHYDAKQCPNCHKT